VPFKVFRFHPADRCNKEAVVFTENPADCFLTLRVRAVTAPGTLPLTDVATEHSLWGILQRLIAFANP